MHSAIYFIFKKLLFWGTTNFFSKKWFFVKNVHENIFFLTLPSNQIPRMLFYQLIQNSFPKTQHVVFCFPKKTGKILGHSGPTKIIPIQKTSPVKNKIIEILIFYQFLGLQLFSQNTKLNIQLLRRCYRLRNCQNSKYQL